MELWLFLTFHISSLLFCLLATRATFRYLSKYRMSPKTKFLMVGFERTRYVAIFYVFSISLLVLFSFGLVVLHLVF